MYTVIYTMEQQQQQLNGLGTVVHVLLTLNIELHCAIINCRTLNCKCGKTSHYEDSFRFLFFSLAKTGKNSETIFSTRVFKSIVSSKQRADKMFIV